MADTLGFGPDHRGFKKGDRVECYIVHKGLKLNDPPFSRRGTLSKRRSQGRVYVVDLDVAVQGRRSWDLPASHVRRLNLLEQIAEAAQ